MAEDITSWISKSIVQHDRENGANYKTPIRGRYVQMIRFSSFRDEFDPHAEIRGVISDKTHWIRVKFNVDTTDEFEEPLESLEAEALTSHLRAIFLIESFTIQLLPPTTSTSLSRRKSNTTTPNVQNTQLGELPEIILNILKWKVVVGDKDDPVFYENTVEVGKGKDDVDVQVQKVLRKWWFGESNSSQPQQPSTSQYQPNQETPSRYLTQNSGNPLKSSPLTGYHSSPALITSSGSASKSLFSTQHQSQSNRTSDDRVMLLDFSQPYINPPGGSKKKVIPEWLFEKSDETREMLSDITMFGLDLGMEDVQDQNGHPGHEVDTKQQNTEGTSRKGKEREIIVSDNLNDPSFELPSTTNMVRRDHSFIANKEQSPQHKPSPLHNATPLSPSPTKDNQRSTSLAQPFHDLARPNNDNLGESEEEEGENILIRPRATTKSRREIFDPLAMPSSSPAQMEMDPDVLKDEEMDNNEDRIEIHQNAERMRLVGYEAENAEEDNDEEGLSDYEKEERRKSKAKTKFMEKKNDHQFVQASPLESINTRTEGPTPALEQGEDEVMEEKEEEEEGSDEQPVHEVSAQYTEVDRSLKQEGNSQNSSKKESQNSQIAKGEILVDDSDQSLSQHHNSLTNTQSNVQENTAHVHSIEDPQHIKSEIQTPSNLERLHNHKAGSQSRHEQAIKPTPTQDSTHGLGTHPERISPSYPTSSTIIPIPELSILTSKDPKVEPLTPAQAQLRADTPSTQSSIKGSRKSFLQNIRFFGSSNRSSVEREKPSSPDPEIGVGSPLSKKRKRNSDESLLERLGKWARGSSLARQVSADREEEREVPNQDIQVDDDQLQNQEASLHSDTGREEEDEDEDVESEDENEYQVRDGLDDGLSGRDEIDEDVQVILVDDDNDEDVEEMEQEVDTQAHEIIAIDQAEVTFKAEVGEAGELLEAQTAPLRNGGKVRINRESKENNRNRSAHITSTSYLPHGDNQPHHQMKEISLARSTISAKRIQSKSVSPILPRRVRKLGNGFRLNFKIDGMSEWEIKKGIENIEKVRARKAGR